jgi:hypothetical protein
MTDAKRHFQIGWDVGGWHCEKGQSQDALVVLESAEGQVRRVGRPFRGNLASVLLNHRAELVRQIISKCEFDTGDDFDATIAIDTPLGWPDAFAKLIKTGLPDVGRQFADRYNPYTRRKTEIDIIERKIRRVDRHGQRHTRETVMPLSPVRDMIGSQSTKGLHFLRAVRSSPVSPGIFRSAEGGISTISLEAYPSLARAACNPEFDRVFRSLRDESEHEDIEDALNCALVAHFYTDRREQIADIPDDESLIDEGWIIYPRPCEK